MAPNEVDAIILGAGMAGLGVGRHLANATGLSYRLVEAADAPGGIARSFSERGFTFDYGIHGLYSSDTAVEDELRHCIRYDDSEIQLRVVDLWNGIVVPHPIQSHLAYLPEEITLECVIGYFTARDDSSELGDNFRSWARAQLGRPIADRFAIPYAEKFWATSASTLSTEWVGARVRIPDARELVRGAISRSKQEVHYVRSIRYPNQGGFGAYVAGLVGDLPIITKCAVAEIDPALHTVLLVNGQAIRYRCLVSTLPLPELCRLIRNCPEQVLAAAGRLHATSLLLVSLGLRGTPQSVFHWGYSFDQQCPFARLSMPSAWAPTNAPQDYWSLQAEVYFTDQPPDISKTMAKVSDWIQRLGLISTRSQIILESTRVLPFANVVFDTERSQVLSEVNRYLDEQGILRCGRYAEWTYFLVDEVLRSAAVIANQVLRRLKQ